MQCSSPRSVQVEQKTKFGPTVPFSFGVFGSNVGASWSGPAGSANVSRWEYTSETALYNMAKNDLVWSGTIRTTEPENVQTAIKSYVEAVVKGARSAKSASRRSEPACCSSKAAATACDRRSAVRIHRLLIS